MVQHFYCAVLIWMCLIILTGCSSQLSSCLDDGIDMEQVQRYLEQDKREELVNQLTIRADNGEVAAQYFLGFLYWSQSEELSFEWFKRSAERGCVEAALNIAQGYSEGKGTEIDLEQAFHWYLKAAESGDGSAMKMVAYLYRQGHGVEQDLEQARYWASRSW